MGETIARLRVSALGNRRSVRVSALVDADATYSSLPARLLAGLGVAPVDKVKIELADGRVVRRELGNVLIELQGKTRATPVMFGRKGDATVVGLVTLEACGLAVDTVNRKLVPLGRIHHYGVRRALKHLVSSGSWSVQQEERNVIAGQLRDLLFPS